MDGALMTAQISPDFASQVEYSLPMSNNVLHMPPHIRSKLASAPDIALLTQEDIMSFIKEVGRCSLGEDSEEKVERLVTLAEDNLGFRLFERIESCKRELGDKETSLFSFMYPGIDLEKDILQKDFHQATQENVDLILDEMDETLKRAQVDSEEIDIVCATGGTSHLTKIKEALKERFSQDKVEEFKQFHSVTEGLSRYAQGLL